MGAALLASWPWDNLGFYKYLLYGPLVSKAVASRAWEAASPDRWILLLLLLFGLRALTYQLWSSYSNMLFATRRRRVVRDGVDFHQIDREWDWDNFLILHVLMAATALYTFPSLRHLPLWPVDARGLAVTALVHAAATEPLAYAAHRAFHGGLLYARYHSLHHSTRVPQPFTAGLATPLEHMVLGALMALPLAAACAAGSGSVALAFAYVLGFDFLRAMGHCNIEVVPSSLFQAVPVLRYLIYTPTYHAIHHTKKEANFCLFMPLFDLLGGTIDPKSWEMHKKMSAERELTQGPKLFIIARRNGATPSAIRRRRGRRGTDPASTDNEGRIRCGRGAGLRVPGARGGRDAVAARVLRPADLRLHALLRAALPAAHVALRRPRHARHVGLVQDLRHLLLQPPRAAAPDLGRPQIRLPVLLAVCQGRHQQADRARHPQGRQDGRQGPKPCSPKQERGAERRRHAVREQAPGPSRARRPRQHADGGGDPERDPQGHGRGVPDGRHVQARQGHRAVPVQEEGPRHDDDPLDGAVPEDPEGGAGEVPALPGAGDQVPVRAALQDVDRRQVAVAAGAAVGAAGHALPPVCRAAHHQLPPGLHLRQARRHAPPQGRAGPGRLRVLAGARGGARVPRRRRRALPRGLHAPRGGRHRRRPHRRRLGGRAQARPSARMIRSVSWPGSTASIVGASSPKRTGLALSHSLCFPSSSLGVDWWFLEIQFSFIFLLPSTICIL
ncbi:uncharacterized protein [Miscanthus floridulus]|uniref:uncharacterized protein isoform X2 n=1 Tax=Miscanthus floridulus TaxID=154761 RepID=UPI00345A0150